AVRAVHDITKARKTRRSGSHVFLLADGAGVCRPPGRVSRSGGLSFLSCFLRLRAFVPRTGAPSMQRCTRSSRISGPATVGHSLDFEAAIAIQAVAMSRKRLPWFAMSMTALAVLGTGGIVFLFVYAFQLAAPPAAAALDEGPPLPPLESRGRAVFRARGCIQCHSVDGSRRSEERRGGGG